MHKVLKDFPYSVDGLVVKQARRGDILDDLPEVIAPGLIAKEYVEASTAKTATGTETDLEIRARDEKLSSALENVAPAIGQAQEGIAVFDEQNTLIGVTGPTRGREGMAITDVQDLVIGATAPVFSAAGEGVALTDAQDRVIGPRSELVADPAPAGKTVPTDVENSNHPKPPKVVSPVEEVLPDPVVDETPEEEVEVVESTPKKSSTSKKK